LEIEAVGTITAGSEWVRTVPKIELHLHLEGAVRPETVRHLSVERLGWSGALASNWPEAYYTYTDFAGFMEQLTPRFPGGPQEYALIAAECFQDLAALGVIYAEVSFDLPVQKPGDDSRFWPVVEALEAERRRAERELPIKINFIAGLMRTLPVDVAMYRTELAIEARRRGISIVAVDLHGDETRGLAEPFAPVYRFAEAHGLGLRAHAGEAVGTGSIWAAIDALGAKRIAHGVRAAEDAALLTRLQQGDVTLEMCPTSNVRTAVVPGLSAHPIRRFYDLGVPVTVNSDDPLPFFTDIERECRILVDQFGFTRLELKNLMQTAARVAFLPETERALLHEQIERGFQHTAEVVGEVSG
jgi:adenosine deaminase